MLIRKVGTTWRSSFFDQNRLTGNTECNRAPNSEIDRDFVGEVSL